MHTTRVRGLARQGAVEKKAPALPDDLTADIDEELDAELFATASTVGTADPEPAAALAQTGDLATTDAALLLGRAFREVWTGQLVLRAQEVEKTVLLAAGRPVYASSTALEDRLGEILLRNGRIDAAARERVARVSAERGRRTGAVLVDFGLLKPGELMPALRGQHEEIVVSVLGWTEGRYRFDPGVEPDARKVRLLRHPVALVREALARGYPSARIRHVLGGSRTVLAAVRGPEADDLVAELSAGVGEREIFGWFDGHRPLEEVVRASGQPEEAVDAVAFLLHVFGVLHPVAGPAARARRVFDQKVDRERILSRYAVIQEADYFQVLGLSREASAADAARAYRRLSDELSPQKISAEVAVALARELDVVRVVLDQAVRVLTDETLRRRYREHLLPVVGRRS
jgi:Domain of unknown function (DUF4388)